MISSLEVIFIHAAVFCQNLEFCFCSCARSEYEIDGRCCPMCAPGNHASRHCNEEPTTCVPCLNSTFIDVPSGLTECFNCTMCEAGRGLRVDSACTRISDTVCEPLDGYYCTDQHKGSCRRADKHKNCNPGQYIKHRGTKDSDTECEACPPGFFSPLGINCTKWTDCLVNGEIKNKEGNSTDVQCRERTRGRYGLIAVAIFLLAAVYLFSFFICGTEATKLKVIPVQETVFDHSASSASLHIPEENKEEDLT